MSAEVFALLLPCNLLRKLPGEEPATRVINCRCGDRKQKVTWKEVLGNKYR